MSDNESTSIEQPAEVQLAPMLDKFRSGLHASRKKLLKDKAAGGKPVFADPEQMRQFLAQFLIPQLVTMVEIFGPALNDTYAFAASNADEVRRLRRKVNDILDDQDEYDDGGPSMESIQAVVTAMHVLGGLLHKKLPDDKELMEAYNAVSQRIDTVLEEMTAADDDDDYDDDDDDDDDDDRDDDDDDGEEPEAQASDAKPRRSKKPADGVTEPEKPSETTDA